MVDRMIELFIALLIKIKIISPAYDCHFQFGQQYTGSTNNLLSEPIDSAINPRTIRERKMVSYV